ncbi:MAG: single-stranded DNA-binding protein [Polaromonas sp.]|nr:single-stranded DNA-binding protein [Polaromonas sp.]
MSKMFGLARLGRDAEIRNTASGEPVASLSLAFTYRAKGEKCTQWVDGSLWGKRAEALAPYLLKGGLISVTLDDVHIETYRKGDSSEGTKLAGRVSDVELAGGGERQDAAPRQAPAPQTARAPAPRQPSRDFDDDIPF